MVKLDGYMSRQGFDLEQNEKNLQLCKAKGLEYVKKVSGMKYGIENYVIIRPSAKPKIKL